MQRSLHLSLSLSGVAALALSNGALLSTAAQEADTAEDLGGVMSISLKDVVKPTIGFQGALQGAGTPNQAGIGGFLPLSISENSVWFLDALANINFADRAGESSIINTEVAGTTISTSSRLGYRWLNGDRSWMFGINGGYDTRPMATGDAETGMNVSREQTVFFQQAAFGLEAVSDAWALNVYGLIPTGTTEYKLNNRYSGGALYTYGMDVGYRVASDWNASVGYYNQHGDDITANNGSGLRLEVEYEISSSLTIGINASYDEAFETRLSGNIDYRFGTGKATTTEKKAWEKPTIQSLTKAIEHRNIRVHDAVHRISRDACNLGNQTSGISQYQRQKGKTKKGDKIDQMYHCGQFVTQTGGGNTYTVWASTRFTSINE